MAKTKEELGTLRKEYELLKSKFKELDDDELQSIAGGTSQNIVVLCSYICPICGNTHTFNMEWRGVIRGFDVISYNACAKTKEVTKLKNVDMPCIRITDSNNKTYNVTYNELQLVQ